MSKYDSLYFEFLDDAQSDLPHNPIARIYVNTFTRATADGPALITPDCVNLRELDYQINRLKSELDAIRTRAAAKFAADSKRQDARAAKV